MHLFVYDKTFEGFLTAVFDSYEMKIVPDKIIAKEHQQTFMFVETYDVITDVRKAERVWNGLHKKLSETACKVLFVVFLSELPDIELTLYEYIRKAMQSNVSIESNFGDPGVMEISKLFKKVAREAEKVRMFVRFQKTEDNIYFAGFNPKYNVIPLAIKHFKRRFSDQRWIVYDTKRNYGFYYDLHDVSEIRFEESKIDRLTGKVNESVLSEDEKIFQHLWKTYFKAIEIKERHNPKLHRQLVPKRFWKYLTEKQ
jgi:probable DNA metabolism protein